MGVSRSASIVLAYLMKHERMPLRAAYEHTAKRRSMIWPNRAFMAQLIRFEKELFGRNTFEPGSVSWDPEREEDAKAQLADLERYTTNLELHAPKLAGKKKAVALGDKAQQKRAAFREFRKANAATAAAKSKTADSGEADLDAAGAASAESILGLSKESSAAAVAAHASSAFC